MATLKVIGLDPSLRNWGVAAGLYDTATKELTIKGLELSQPELPTGKQTRQNSKDLEAAYQHTSALLDILMDADVIFAEVPVGSQSSRAMASYGICVGVLGALRAMEKPFFEVTPNEVKLVATGRKTASKQDMVDWATAQHPEADWPTQKSNGQQKVVVSKAEHMADAVASIYAGLRTNDFQRMLKLLAPE